MDCPPDYFCLIILSFRKEYAACMCENVSMSTCCSIEESLHEASL